MDNSYTNTVLQAISRALNEGIQDLRAVTIVVAAIIILAVMVPVIIRLKNRKRIHQTADTSYQKLIRKFNLTILELDLLDRLSATLKKKDEKYQLLINQGKLRQAAKRTGDLSETETELLEQLKIKLGFEAPAIQSLENSTRLLMQGTPLKIRFNENEIANAEVYSTAESNITIKYSNQDPPVIPDQEILVFAPSSGRILCFRLLTDKVREELFTASHTEAEAFEKISVKISITAKVIPEPEEDEQPEDHIIKSVIVLLSPQGAFILDKKSELVPGDTIEIYFSNDKKNLNPICGEVIKVSEEKRLASVRFIDLTA